MGQLVNLYKEEDVTVEGELVAFANPWKAGWLKELEIAAIQKAELEGHNAAVDGAAVTS